MIADVYTLVQMQLGESTDRFEVKQLRVFCFRRCQRLHQHRSKRSPEPIVRRNIEAYLLALNYSGGQLRSHHFLEEILLARTADFEI